jgi:hypothetical protein
MTLADSGHMDCDTGRPGAELALVGFCMDAVISMTKTQKLLQCKFEQR